MNKADWKQSTHWLRRGDGFSVEIKHSVDTVRDDGKGPNRWCVYAYIYPGHPRLTLYDPGTHTLFQPISRLLGLHGGASYFVANHDHKGLTSVQIGSDYNHLYDFEFTIRGADEMPWDVANDADKLFGFLQRESQVGAVLPYAP